jgi:recombination protein RecR
MRYPKSIDNLIKQLTKLPSVGPRMAERFVFYLLNQDAEELQHLAQAIAELKEKTLVCSVCHAVADQSPCEICRDQGRDHSTISVVANTRDLLVFESAKEYRGAFHVLGGVINTIEGTKPENLHIRSLLTRIKKQKTKEVILALNPNLEGETTSMYLSKLLKTNFPNLRISRLARGLAMGTDLEYADEMTLLNAIRFRNTL